VRNVVELEQGRDYPEGMDAATVVEEVKVRFRERLGLRFFDVVEVQLK